MQPDDIPIPRELAARLLKDRMPDAEPEDFTPFRDRVYRGEDTVTLGTLLENQFADTPISYALAD